MYKSVLFLVSAIASTTYALPNTKCGAEEPICSCAESSDLLKVDTYSLTPIHPKAGSKGELNFEGVVSEVITEGWINLDLTVGGWLPIQTSVALSKISNLKMPIQPGKFKLYEEGILPAYVTGSLAGKVTLTSGSEAGIGKGKRITCLNVDVEIG
eukprot:Pgem_evm1s2782